ncbi:MAG: alpha/beta hydrolase [Methylovulum sp.]|nr:alpha/beta hydrolase [Methylovulum sp.]
MTSQQGQHWVLLRGLARESAHWGAFVPLLKARFPNAQVTLLDLPGTGRGYQHKSPYSISAITGQVRRDADAAGLLQQPVTLLAVSLGAMVGWEWLQRYPDEVCGAVLMNTSFASLSPFYRRLRWQSYGRFCALAMQRDVYRRERAIVQLVSNKQDHYAAIAEQWAKIQAERPISFNNSFRQIIAAATYRPAHEKPKQPVLLLNGKGDRLVSPACSKAIQQRWQLELRSHPWAGHDLTTDDGDWVVSQLQDWL